MTSFSPKFLLFLLLALIGNAATAQTPPVWTLSNADEPRVSVDFMTGGVFPGTNSESTSLRVRNNTSNTLRVDYSLTVTDICGTPKFFTGNCAMKPGETKGGDVGFSAYENWHSFNVSCGQVRAYGSDQKTKISHVRVEYTIRDLTAEENARKAAEAEERERREEQARQAEERRRQEAERQEQERARQAEAAARERELERQRDLQRLAERQKSSTNTSSSSNTPPQETRRAVQTTNGTVMMTEFEYQSHLMMKEIEAKEARDQEAWRAEQQRLEAYDRAQQAKMQQDMQVVDAAYNAGAAVYNIFAQAAEEKRARKAYEAQQRAEEQRQEQARIAREKAELDMAVSIRQELARTYKDSRLPLGNEHGSRTHALYYFIYTYWPGHATEKTFTVTTAGPFQVCRAGDGSWPMERDVREKMEPLTPHTETLVGPFDSRLSAQKARDQFVVALQRSGGNVVPSTFDWPCTTDAEGWVDEWQVAPASRTVNGWTVVEGEQESAPKGNDEWTPR